MARMRVFHGGCQPVPEPRVIVGRHAKDFGNGFYCTILREQAERWARRYETPTVSTYDVRLDDRLDILEFEEMTDEWLDFIASCRNGKPHDYDIVIGAMANDQIYNFVADFIDGSIMRNQFWALARFKYPTHQIAFCTPAALACLEYAGASEVVR